MKAKKSLLKKIEHCLVLFIFFGGLAFNVVIMIWGSDLGLVKESSDPGDTSSDCAPDPRYPC